MGTLEEKKLIASDINGGQKLESSDALFANDVNNIVEGQLYLQNSPNFDGEPTIKNVTIATTTYADEQANAAESSAKTYADEVSATAEQNARNHATTVANAAKSNAVSEAKTYTDSEIAATENQLNAQITAIRETGGIGTAIYRSPNNVVATANLTEEHPPEKQIVIATKEYVDEKDSENAKRIKKLSALHATVYGVKIDTKNSNPSTSVTYTDAASGYIAASGNNGNYLAGSLDSCYPWNAIKPCLLKEGNVVGYLNPKDFTKFENGSSADITSGNAGDVMIEIPVFYYKFSKVGNFLEIKVSDMELEGYSDYAFSYKGKVKDKFYIGAYLGHMDASGKLRSTSGVMPTGSQTLGQFRSAAQANGAGYEQLSFNKLTALQILFILQFKNLNSQKGLGSGYTLASDSRNTGTTNAFGITYGTNSSRTASDTIKFNGIEDFWGNYYQWIDGYVSATNSVKISDGEFNDIGIGYKNCEVQLSASTGCLSEVVGGNYTAFTPKAANGSTSTYYSDLAIWTPGYLPIFGGTSRSDVSAGLFRFECKYSQYKIGSTMSARLVYNG